MQLPFFDFLVTCFVSMDKPLGPDFSSAGAAKEVPAARVVFCYPLCTSVPVFLMQRWCFSHLHFVILLFSHYSFLLDTEAYYRVAPTLWPGRYVATYAHARYMCKSLGCRWSRGGRKRFLLCFSSCSRMLRVVAQEAGLSTVLWLPCHRSDITWALLQCCV